MVPPYKALMLAGAASVAMAQAAYAQTDAPGAKIRAIATPRITTKAVDAPFRPIAASQEDMTLRGELASSEHAVFLSPNDALRANAFRIGFSNAVSNLPSASRLMVKINDQQVGEVSLNASGQLGQAVFPVPVGVLVPGFNSVRFTASQRHRVDCSINATYELWTEVSPTHTGFVNVSATPQIKRAADLPMLAGIAAGRTPIRIRLAEGAGATAIDQAMRAASALILAGSITHPQIEVSSEPGSGPGLDLVVGNLVPAAPGTRLEPDLGLFLGQDGPGERTVMSIHPVAEADVDTTIQRIEALAAARTWPGSKAGQRAIANMLGRRIANNSSISFADLGMEARAFDGHLLQLSTRVMLPPDFFPAPYGAARISLNSAFMGAATTGHRISIRVNDQIAAIVPIMKPGQGGLDDRSIELPLQGFKPGANVVSVEANLTEHSAACDATVSQSSGSRLVISPGSTISFGRLARVASFPNLSATLGYGMPYSDGKKPMAVGVSKQDPAFLDGALTMVGRMVASAQMPIGTALRFGPLDSSGESGIFFGSPVEVPREPEVLGSPVASLSSDVLITTANAQTRLAAAEDAAQGSDKDPTTFTLVKDIRAAFNLSGASSEMRRMVRGDFSSITTWLAEFGLADKRKDALASANLEISGEDLVIRQSVVRAPGATWRNFFDETGRPAVQTQVLAADATKFVELIDKATTDQFWSRLAGDTARVRLADWGPTNRFVREPVYAASSDTSPANMRLVAAGWLSLNQGYYLTIIGALLLLLATMTALTLRVRRL